MIVKNSWRCIGGRKDKRRVRFRAEPRTKGDAGEEDGESRKG